MALYSVQDTRQIDKALLLQASWLIEIEEKRSRRRLVTVASIESRDKSRRIRRTRSLKMKTDSSAAEVPIISSSYNAIELQRIMTRDGFSYFSTTND